MNKLCKYADDTTLIVPSNSDICLTEEFDNVKNWAEENKLMINFKKTTEVVFRRPNPKLFIHPDPIDTVEQTTYCKLLGV